MIKIYFSISALVTVMIWFSVKINNLKKTNYIIKHALSFIVFVSLFVISTIMFEKFKVFGFIMVFTTIFYLCYILHKLINDNEN